MPRPDIEFDSLLRLAQQLAQQQSRDGATPERTPALVAATQCAAGLLDRYAGRNGQIAELVRTVRHACGDSIPGADPRQPNRPKTVDAPVPADPERVLPAA